MPSLEELAADLAAFKTQAVTQEELLFSVPITAWNGADDLRDSVAVTLLVAPFPLKVLSAAFSWEYGGIPASTSHYWTATLNKGSNPTSFKNVASRSTQPAGAVSNGPIQARTAWTFDAATWENADLAAGDLLRVTFNPTGAPPPIPLPFIVTLRYAAL